MTLEANKKLILEHYEAVTHKQDADAIRRQVAPDFVDHEMPPGTPPGPETVIEWSGVLHKAFPNLRITVEDMVAEGDRVAVRATWTGTHSGPFPALNIAPTNRSFVLTGMVFWRIRDGKITERWATLDRMGWMQQLTGEA
jgi:steroid delta-isomerase-like uncharacterized protein